MTISDRDGHYFSPDGGKFEKLADKLYWETGEITKLGDNPMSCVIRCLPSETGERYSQWTDEYRVTVIEGWRAKREQWATERENQQREQDALLESAAAKLTEAEYQAVVNSGER